MSESVNSLALIDPSVEVPGVGLVTAAEVGSGIGEGVFSDIIAVGTGAVPVIITCCVSSIQSTAASRLSETARIGTKVLSLSFWREHLKLWIPHFCTLYCCL